MNVADYILQALDQTDPDDRLITPEIVQAAAKLARIRDRRALQALSDQHSGLTLESTGDSRYMTFVLDDLFGGDPVDALSRTTYFFSPAFYIHDIGRRVLVDGTVVSSASYTFDERQCEVTFTDQQTDGSIIEVSGLLVDFADLMNRCLAEIESRLAMTPDVHGARHQEWQKRVAHYKRKNFGMQMP